jgi:hypothetical protein
MLILNIIMINWVVPKGSKTIIDSADDPEKAILLDVHPFWFTKAEALQALQAIGEQGRQQYIRFHKQQDLAFPFVYGSFLAFSLFLLNRKRLQKRKIIYLIPAVPLLAMMADLIENHHIVLLTTQYPDLDHSTLKIAAIANAIKWGSVSLSLLMIVMFTALNIVGMFRRINLRKSSKNPH